MKRYRLLIVMFATLVLLQVVSAFWFAEDDRIVAHWAVSEGQLDWDDDLDWKQGRSTNQAFTDSVVLFKVDFASLVKEHSRTHFLTVHPSYLDRIEVEFRDINNHALSSMVKGDKHGDLNLYYGRDVDQFVYQIPPHAVKARIKITSTSGMLPSIDIVDDEELFIDVAQGVSIKIATIAFLMVAVILATLIWWSLRKRVYLFFVAYLMAWVGLLIGHSNLLTVFDSGLLRFNDALVSWMAIGSAIAGYAFFYQILSMIMRPNWLSKIMCLMIWVGLGNFLIYLFIDSRTGLMLNILSILLSAALLLLLVPTIKGKDHRASFVINKVRTPFALLILYVFVSSSGFGQSKLFSLSFLHAVLAVIFNGYFLWLWYTIERRHSALAQVRSRALSLVNDGLNKQIDEQNTLFAMLFHEIKTPLTSLKFILFGWDKKPEADIQIDHIRHVLEQVELMQTVDQPHRQGDFLSIVDTVYENWQSLLDQQHHDVQLEFTHQGPDRVYGNAFLFNTIVKEHLNNWLFSWLASNYCSNSSNITRFHVKLT